MEYLKNFNESFSNQTYYKLILKENFQGKKTIKLGYVINKIHLDGWMIPNRTFGSLIQALIYFPSRSKKEMLLLKIDLPSGDHKIRIRNVDLMLKNLTKYKKSQKQIFKDDDLDINYDVIETIIDERMETKNIQIVNEFVANDLFTKNKIDPNDMMSFIFGNMSISELKIIGHLSTFNLVSKYTLMKLKYILGF